MTTPSRLHYTDMEGKEPHWEVDHYGQISIPSPIPVFPKPLALSYRNLYRDFGNHKFEIKEEHHDEHPRAQASCLVVKGLLNHCFPNPDLEVEQIWPGYYEGELFTYESLVADMPVMGTWHFIVQQKNKKGEGIVAIVAVVTDPAYFSLAERKQPTRLEILPKFVDSKGRLAVQDDKTMSYGAFVILTGTMNTTTSPITPAFEFYEFCSPEPKAGLRPWYNRATIQTPAGPTNSIPLAPNHAGEVDFMFKDIAEYATKGKSTAHPSLPGPSRPNAVDTITPKKRTAAQQPEPSVLDRSKRAKSDGQNESADEIPSSPVARKMRTRTPSWKIRDTL